MNTSIIPTAEDFLSSKVYITNDAEEGESESVHDSISTVSDVMIEFARLHVKLALETALENVPYGGSDQDILNCYPPELIA